jgi:gas vesicle protein
MNDYDSRVNYLGTFLAGMILGGLVGAAVAMLLAPASGPDTRRQIREKSLELRSQAELEMEQARKRATELQERGRVILEEQKTRITKAVDEARHNMPAGEPAAPAEPSAESPAS